MPNFGVIAGRAEGASPVIPIPGHGLTLLSEMAGTRPAMTFQFLARAWLADPDGALYWPEQGLLAVADLHLEKGSSFAARGVLLPPYDTAATLARLARLVAHYAPRYVIALGDSFHDGGGPARLADDDREALRIMQRGREWIWITGNHDPEPADRHRRRHLSIH